MTIDHAVSVPHTTAATAEPETRTKADPGLVVQDLSSESTRSQTHLEAQDDRPILIIVMVRPLNFSPPKINPYSLVV